MLIIIIIINNNIMLAFSCILYGYIA